MGRVLPSNLPFLGMQGTRWVLGQTKYLSEPHRDVPGGEEQPSPEATSAQDLSKTHSPVPGMRGWQGRGCSRCAVPPRSTAERPGGDTPAVPLLVPLKSKREVALETVGHDQSPWL